MILSLHAYVPFAHSGFVALTVDIFAAIPIAPGGIGQIESVYDTLLLGIIAIDAGRRYDHKYPKRSQISQELFC